MPDFQPYEIIEGDYDKGMVLLADHAMNLLPQAYGNLGLPQAAFERHIAYDIGVEGLTRKLAASLGVPAVLGRFSRLLIDPNRGEDDPTLIMKISDGAVVPGNHPITDEEWERRLDSYHRPYHNAVDRVLTKAAETTGKAPLVFSLQFLHALLEVRSASLACGGPVGYRSSGSFAVDRASAPER